MALCLVDMTRPRRHLHHRSRPIRLSIRHNGPLLAPRGLHPSCHRVMPITTLSRSAGGCTILPAYPGICAKDSSHRCTRHQSFNITLTCRSGTHLARSSRLPTSHSRTGFTIDRDRSLRRLLQDQGPARSFNRLFQLTTPTRRSMTFEARQLSRHSHHSPVIITANFRSRLNIHLQQ